ncbi:hypothetical protein AGABI2DRAFT_185212 [Agaricus bisporus var. bisporus H97]|uniref:hypothetical protein n=1 Tax=Agaricus bisporus var. bisporus (strain H97 / ATCC MYA-4626 / FGSC 10389) TaxID=936046 RepID=UPI00029F71AF|nr:hypothetical protein AGABI2DRAFT_185212 [Agaricus bisporus var. bisporus H97]EKV47219.1 hypothetical protein AGABI2DRAFT_185212 [Agaricus bisporus var. bisporus H97]
MDIEQFRKAGYNAIDRICDYYYNLQSMPVKSSVSPGYLAQHIPTSPPEQGEPWQQILDDYTEHIIPGLTHWQHPSFYGYFPTACSFPSMLAELLASSTPNPGFNWSCSPACTELEALMMDWAADLLGLHKEFFNSSNKGGGVIQTTASDSALVAIVAARSRYQRLHPDVPFKDLIIYTTTQTHSLGLKAGLILGIGVRAIEVDAHDKYALRGSTLRKALEEDAADGKHPFILIATLGTTSSGASDNMPEIRNIAKDYPSLWIHVDAAWAGVVFSCPEYRDKLYHTDINEMATSFCTNFHKWGLVNFDCSAFWVRDRSLLTEALDITPPFLRTKEGDSGQVVDYRNWHLALGRRFRSLKMWFVFRTYGVDGFQGYIRRCIGLNTLFQEKINETSSLLELVTAPSLSLSVVRISPAALSPSSSPSNSTDLITQDFMNTLNQTFYSRLSARNDIFLTQTILNGAFCIRFSIGAELTTEDDICRAVDTLIEEAKNVVEELRVKNDKTEQSIANGSVSAGA